MSKLDQIFSNLEKPKSFTQLKKDSGLENGVLQHHINHSDRIERKKKSIMKKGYCDDCGLKSICRDECILKKLCDDRKMDVAQGIERGLTQAEIGKKLGITKATVNFHLKDLRESNIMKQNSIREEIRPHLQT